MKLRLFTRKLKEHWSHKRHSCHIAMFKYCICIVYQAVFYEYTFSNYMLNATTLNPWLSITVCNPTVSSHKGIKDTNLVKHNIKILRWIPIIPRNI